MEERIDFDKLFISYLMKELNGEEEAYVNKIMDTDPKLRRRFEELERVCKLLNIQQNIDEIDLDAERRHFDTFRIQKAAAPVENDNHAGVIPIQENTNRTRIIKLLRPIAVAASVIFLVVLGWNLIQTKERKETGTAQGKELVDSTRYTALHTESNYTGKQRKIALKDGSQVVLWNNSEIAFKDPFEENKRDVYLKGKASFKVAKDAGRPFTVFSGDITTTALGTEFLVTSYEKENLIRVRLIEGKVVVRSVDSLLKRHIKPFYLVPGQELIYDKLKGTAKVVNFKTAGADVKQTATEAQVPNDNPALPKHKEGSWYMFNNQSLPEIFDELERMFGVDIDYKKKEVQQLYFIGKFEKSDSLDYIIRNLAAINNLIVVKGENKYVIRK